MKKTIEIAGSTQKRREVIYEATQFFFDKLLPKHKIYLKINLIHNLSIKETIAGDTTWDDQNNCPREFIIRLDSALSIDDILWTLAHEMIHLKQYAKGELYDYSRIPYTRWKNEKIDSDKYSYAELPWEIEAFKMDRKLYDEYLEWKHSNV